VAAPGLSTSKLMHWCVLYSGALLAVVGSVGAVALHCHKRMMPCTAACCGMHSRGAMAQAVTGHACIYKPGFVHEYRQRPTALDSYASYEASGGPG
jgi:hypothetical protein